MLPLIINTLLGVTKKQAVRRYRTFMSCHVKCGDKTWNKKLAKVILIVSVTRACGGEKGRIREGEGLMTGLS